MEQEIWKDIIGYENLYQVSNHGRVKSLATPRMKKPNPKYFSKRQERVFTPCNDRWGYPKLALSRNASPKSFYVHRLVAKAFVPNPDNKPEVNHLDFDKTNNTSSNLEWCTNKENNDHAYRGGKGSKINYAKRQKKIAFPQEPLLGELCSSSKYTAKQILNVRALWGTNLYTQKQLAVILGSTEKYIFKIVHRQYWKHI